MPAVIGGIALVVRLVFFFQLRGTPFFNHLFSDSLLYSSISRDLLTYGFHYPSSFFMSPLYPITLALVDMISGDMLVWIRLLQIVVSSVAVSVLVVWGKEVFGHASGVLAGLLLAFYEPSVFYDNMILLESFQTSLVVFHLWTLHRALESRKRAWFVVSGLCAGALVVNRASIAIYLVMLIAYLWLGIRSGRWSWKNIALFLLPVVILATPFVAWNTAKEKTPVGITTSAGFNLYAGNHAGSTGLYAMPEGIDLARDPNGVQFLSRLTGKSMSSAEASSYWMDKSLEWMTTNPGDAVVLIIRKLGLFWNAAEIDQLGLSIDFFRQEFSTLLRLPLVGFGSIAVIGLAGLILAIRRKKLPVTILIFLVGYVLSIVLFFVSGRLRLPLAPVLILLVAYALVNVYVFIADKSWKELAFLVLTAVLAGIPTYALQVTPKPDFSNEYSRMGQAYFDEGLYTEAELAYRKALERKEKFRYHMNLGNALAAQGKFKLALEEYDRARAMNPESPELYFNMGNLALQMGRANDAARMWMTAIRKDSLFALP
ncbi:MAG: tetratricopeptide repeat protein, partial [Chlorobi bacterium]|nr:tetratricopeptide repeat protein [Chlorobiota bacterium]